MNEKNFGDFQTPPELVEKVCEILDSLGSKPRILIEPSCGVGNFILGSINRFKEISYVLGIELQKKYVKQCKENLSKIEDKKIEKKIIESSLFDYNFDKDIVNSNEEILILGNPPWVTNSNLQGENLPRKSNFKKIKGLDAITGKANFDISEYFIIYLIKQFENARGKLAFLCKTQVAKNLLKFMPQSNLKAENFRIFRFDAKSEFGASVEACLFVMDLDGDEKNFQCQVFDIGRPKKRVKTFGWIGDNFVSNVDEYQHTKEVDGKSQLIWRSGIKHDCSNIMQLKIDSKDKISNGFGEIISVEDKFLYPLLKGSDIGENVITNSNKRIIITQKKPKESTEYLEKESPKLWNYLISKKEFFEKRKSSIYNEGPKFSIFGVGDYSFFSYKVGISGLYKRPKFSLIIPQGKKPVMVDDGCYTIGSNRLEDCVILWAILNSKISKEFLDSVTFRDSMRPYTKEILMRIDLLKLLDLISIEEINSYVHQFQELSNINLGEKDILLLKEYLRG